MFAKRGDMRLLWLDKNPNDDKIMATQKELQSLRDQMQDRMTAHRLAVLKILTPEQQSAMQSYGGRGMGMGRGFGMGFGAGQGGCQGGGPRSNW
jgi:Spy/CpxP family protein refolding chaperone